MTSSNELPNLERARRGDQQALGRLLEEQRDWLHRMAQGEINGPLRARMSASDLVQQTCLSAIRQFPAFAGENDAQFRAWLKGVHRHNIQEAIRQHVFVKKRAANCEQSLDAGGSDLPPAARNESPSGQICRDESSDRLRAAIAALPVDQGTAVRLRHLEQRSLSDIAADMERTEVAVASLLKRGLESLRRQLGTTGDA